MRRRLGFGLVLAVFALVVFETAARVFVVIEFHGWFLRPETAIFDYYRELESLMEQTPKRGDEPIDVLLLGGSVPDPGWSAIERVLIERLMQELRRPVTIHNLSAPAHSSRDSYLKYKRLEKQRYDLVVFYHGINEVRANNVPPELFDPDYDHLAWYREVNALDRQASLRWLALPWALHFGLLELTEPELIPMHKPRKKWLSYGSDVKTVASFRANLEHVIEIARERGDPLMVMTFATYLPDDYSQEAFEANQLDYTRHRIEVEKWGTPENVLAGVRAHNTVVRELALRHSDVAFVDQAGSLPQRRENFDDVCHLTTLGSAVFVEAMVPEMLRILAAADAAEPSPTE